MNKKLIKYFAVYGMATLILSVVACKFQPDLSNYNVVFNNQYYESIDDALAKNESGTITLLKDEEIAENYIFSNGQELKINLNGKNLTSNRINIEKANIEICGTGTITGDSSAKSSACFSLTGDAKNENASKYSTLKIGKDVVINNDAYSIMVSSTPKSTNQKSSNQYGVEVIFAGKDNSAYGIYINGNITNEANPVKINIESTATVSEIYGAGFAKWKIDGGNFSNTCEFKAGIIQIDGGTFNATGNKLYSLNGNGSNFEGYALVIESQNGYGKGANCTINGGNFGTEIIVANFDTAINNTLLNITGIGTNSGVLKTENTIVNVPANVTVSNFEN